MQKLIHIHSIAGQGVYHVSLRDRETWSILICELTITVFIIFVSFRATIRSCCLVHHDSNMASTIKQLVAARMVSLPGIKPNMLSPFRLLGDRWCHNFYPLPMSLIRDHFITSDMQIIVFISTLYKTTNCHSSHVDLWQVLSADHFWPTVPHRIVNAASKLLLHPAFFKLSGISYFWLFTSANGLNSQILPYIHTQFYIFSSSEGMWTTGPRGRPRP